MIVPVFWGSVAALTGTYVLFPLVTVVKSWLRPVDHAEGPMRLSLSVVIAAHNEVASIGGKLDNVLRSHYDPSLLDVVVAADGCTDGTEAVVAGYA